jgi:rare lipoprotein A
VPKEPPASPRVEHKRAVYAERGIASWYGKEFHGNATASGEVYSMFDMTAAHKTLPLGTSVVVTNLENRRSVAVRVNDRGPFVKGRIIDLSFSAAKAIGMMEKGTAPVEIVALEMEGVPDTGPPIYKVQVGSFSDKENAEDLLFRLRRGFPEAYMTVLETDQGRFYRVRVGRFKNEETAYKTAERLAASGFTALVTSR